MLNEIDLHDILFLDIETVPQYSNFDELPDKYKILWDKKSKFFREPSQEASEVYERAGIYAEFGKIVCISVGIIPKGKHKVSIRLKSYYDDNETVLLKAFSAMAEKFETGRLVYLCAHNGKEFDFPYIARRLLVNGLKILPSLNNAGKKPWEIRHLDTLELWKFGDYKHYTSLDLLTTIFNIPSPKEDMDGSMVGTTYWRDRDLNRIAAYCQNDVLALAQLIMRYKGLPLIESGNIELAEN